MLFKRTYLQGALAVGERGSSRQTPRARWLQWIPWVALLLPSPLAAGAQGVDNPFLGASQVKKFGGEERRGGGYGGPGDTVPPGGTGGSTSGGSAGAPASGGSSGSGAGSGAGSGGTIPGSAGGGNGPGQPAPATTGAPNTPQTGSAAGQGIDWTRWFDLAREELLEDLINPQEVTYGSTGFFLGVGSEESTAPGPDQLRPDLAHSSALGALLTLLEEPLPLNVELEYLLALGRAFEIASPAEQDQLAARLTTALAHDQRGHAEVATIAMGVAGDRRFATLLSHVLADDPEGRSAVLMGRVPLRQRAFAAQSLGLIGRKSQNEDVRRFCVHHLTSALGDSAALPDLEAACLMALGGIPLQQIPSHDPAGVAEAPSQSRTALLRLLLQVLEARRGDSLQFVPGAIARLTSDLPRETRDTFLAAIVPVWQAVFGRGKRPSSWERAGNAIALGQMAELGVGAFDTLLREWALELAEDPDDGVRQYALLALGRIAGRPERLADGSPSVVGLEPLIDLLVQRSRRGASNQRAAAMLGLALAQRGLERRGASAPAKLGEALADGLSRGTEPGLAAAAVIAGGCSGLPQLEQRLTETYANLPQQSPVRARAAYGLAMHQGLKGRAILRLDYERRPNDPATVTALVRSLMLLGDARVLGEGVQELQGSTSIPRSIGWIDAFALTGTSQGAQALIELSKASNSRPSALRARAVRGLGLLAASGNRDWARSVAQVANLQAQVATWSDAYSGGLFDLYP